MGAGKPKLVHVEKDELAESPVRSRWTRVDQYFAALARRRTERRKREPQRPRTQPDEPRFALSTLPILALLVALAVLAVGIIVAAWPGRDRPQPRPKVEQRVPGTAPPGWWERAERDMAANERNVASE